MGLSEKGPCRMYRSSLSCQGLGDIYLCGSLA